MGLSEGLMLLEHFASMPCRSFRAEHECESVLPTLAACSVVVPRRGARIGQRAYTEQSFLLEQDEADMCLPW